MNSITKLFVFLFIALLSSSAFALGGLDEANSTIVAVRNGIYIAVGSFAGLYLLVLIFLVKMERKTWGDLFSGAMYVAVAGGVIILSTWLFSLFQ